MDYRHPGSQDAPETSMSVWIPALHAGMTGNRRVLLELTEAFPAPYFQRRRSEEHEVWTQKFYPNHLWPSCALVMKMFDEE
jgi:hypothetical protein